MLTHTTDTTNKKNLANTWIGGADDEDPADGVGRWGE